MGRFSCEKPDSNKDCRSNKPERQSNDERNGENRASSSVEVALLDEIVVRAKVPEREEISGRNDERNGEYRGHSHKPVKKASSLDLFKHYRKGNGETKTLRELGLLDEIIELVKSPNELDKTDGHSVQGDFIQQILQGNTSFKQIYRFGKVLETPRSEGRWAIGHATLEGHFVGKVHRYREKDERSYITTYTLEGDIHYHFHDRFKDPADTFNLIEKDIEFGTPFDIIDSWDEKIDIKISRWDYDRLRNKFNR